MAYKYRGDQYAADRRWRQANPEAARESRRKVRSRIVNMIRHAKATACMDCDKFYPYYVMDLDHRPDETKECVPGQMPYKGWGVERVQKELDKCDAVCSNCHRIRTHNRLLA